METIEYRHLDEDGREVTSEIEIDWDEAVTEGRDFLVAKGEWTDDEITGLPESAVAELGAAILGNARDYYSLWCGNHQ